MLFSIHQIFVAIKQFKNVVQSKTDPINDAVRVELDL